MLTQFLAIHYSLLVGRQQNDNLVDRVSTKYKTNDIPLCQCMCLTSYLKVNS